jgi:hypothetical protein
MTSRLKVILVVLGISLAAVPGHVFGQPSVYSADNQFVGFYVGGAGLEAVAAGADPATAYRVVSVRGYTAGVSVVSGRVTGYLHAHPGAWLFDSVTVSNEEAVTYFSSTDCTGQGYRRLNGIGSSTTLTGGVVFSFQGPSGPELQYVPKTVVMQRDLTLLSARGSTGCNPSGLPPGSFHNGLPVLPNDPDVTGIPNTPFTAPLRIEPFPLSDVRLLFTDGFETPPPENA